VGLRQNVRRGEQFQNLTSVDTNRSAAVHPESKVQAPALESHPSLSAPSRPVFDLFGEEIQTKRTGRFINAYILALQLIALHKKIALEFLAERVLVLQGNLNILRYNTAKKVCLSAS
jgi:hypothetical protein